MRQKTDRPHRRRQKRCRKCGQLFLPNSRTKDAQQYCSKSDCQRARQRCNESAWRARNPDCVQLQYEQSQQWRTAHPDYYRQYRQQKPKITQANRQNTAQRMRRLRQARLFAKSKSILTQFIGIKQDECLLAPGSDWILLRLQKASPLPALLNLTHNQHTGIQNPADLLQQTLFRVTDLPSKPEDTS